MRGIGSTLGGVAAAVALLAGAGDAAATTFCIPGFHEACRNNGSNVATKKLQTALKGSGDDGIADLIVIDAGPHNTSPEPYALNSGDNDDLEIVGAGPDQTVITNSDTGNPFMMNLNGARDITMRDLTLQVPASFDDGNGGALQTDRGTFVNVDFESLNPGSDAVRSAVGGGTFTDGRVYGSGIGTIDVGFATNGAEGGEMVIERMLIESPSWGIVVEDGNVPTRVRRTVIADPLAYGLRFTKGAFAVVENTIVTVDDGYAISAQTNDNQTLIFSMRHSTIADTGGDDDPVVQVGDGFTAYPGAINGVISDTIIAGNENPLDCNSPQTSTNLTLRYTYFFHSANVNGNCAVNTIQTLDAYSPELGPPQFVGATDFHLPVGSPAIDSGDPLTVTLPTQDFDGAPRPVDGDGDGEARRDIGAFEYQPPLPPSGGGPESPTADTTPPQTKIVKGPGKKLASQGRAKFSFASTETGSSFTCKLDRRKASRCRSPRRHSGLKPGRHVFRVWATDAAGNKDPTPAKRRFRVPG